MIDALKREIAIGDIVIRLQRPLQIGVILDKVPVILFWMFHKDGLRTYKIVEPRTEQLIVVSESELLDEFELIKTKSRNVKNAKP